MLERQAIIEAARSWIGTPYLHQGRTKGPDGAIDCIGYIWGVANDLGYKTEIPANYSPSPGNGQLIQGCDRLLIKAPKRALPGSIGVLYGIDRTEAQHFCIFAADDAEITMVHAFSKRKQVIENPFSKFWSDRLVAVYEYPDTGRYTSPYGYLEAHQHAD